MDQYLGPGKEMEFLPLQKEDSVSGLAHSRLAITGFDLHIQYI